MSSSEDAFESADEGEDESQRSHKLHSKKSIDPHLLCTVDEPSTCHIKVPVTSSNSPADNSKDGWEVFSDDDGGDSTSPFIDPVDEFGFPNKTSTRAEKPEKTAKVPSKPRVPLRLEKKSSLTPSSTTSLKQSEIQVLEKLSLSATENSKPFDSSSSWGFGSWGSSLLSCASSVTEFTSHVSQGLGVVMNTVEATLGVPSPEELVKQGSDPLTTLSGGDQSQASISESAQGKSSVSAPQDGKGAASHLFVSVASLTHVLETTGSKVLTSGLDTLEIIGKKTMDIITDMDPGLGQKKLLLNQRDVSAHKEGSDPQVEDEQQPQYNNYFEEERGKVHLEALELLAGKTEAHIRKGASDTKWIHKLLEEGFIRIQEQEDSLEGEQCVGFTQDIDECLTEMGIGAQSTGEIIKVAQCYAWKSIDFLKEEGVCSPKEVYKAALVCLARLTAKTMELVHKLAELLVKESWDVCTVIDQLLRLAETICREIGRIAMAHVSILNKQTVEQPEDESATVDCFSTYIFLEVSNSKCLIQDAFMHIVPILQQRQIELT